MDKGTFGRGNALPETALTMSLVMLVFLGLIKLAFVGFEQSQVDGAAFVAAHAASISLTSPSAVGQTRAHADFGIPAANITFASVETSPPNWKGDYTAQTSLNAGGLFTNQAFGGSVFSLHSFAVEPIVQQAVTVPLVPATVANNAQLSNCVTNVGASALGSPRFVSSCAPITMPSPAPSPSAPLEPFECRLAYYSTLTHYLSANIGLGGTPTNDGSPSVDSVIAQYPWTANLSVPGGSANGPDDFAYWSGPSASKLSSLDTGNSATNYYAWPHNFGYENNVYNDSINEVNHRSYGWWFQNNGTAGALIKPIMGFGTTYCT
jgi:hypothetical protein